MIFTMCDLICDIVTPMSVELWYKVICVPLLAVSLRYMHSKAHQTSNIHHFQFWHMFNKVCTMTELLISEGTIALFFSWNALQQFRCSQWHAHKQACTIFSDLQPSRRKYSSFFTFRKLLQHVTNWSWKPLLRRNLHVMMWNSKSSANSTSRKVSTTASRSFIELMEF